MKSSRIVRDRRCRKAALTIIFCLWRSRGTARRPRSADLRRLHIWGTGSSFVLLQAALPQERVREPAAEVLEKATVNNEPTSAHVGVVVTDEIVKLVE